MARNLERARIDIQRLVDAVQSRDAIRQFCDLVNTRREPSLEDSIRSSHSHFQRPPGVDLPTLSAARYLILLNRGQQTSKIMTRIHQYLLAKICADHKQGSLRLESDMKKNILRISGLSSHQYDWQVSRGKKWIRLCGEDFDGVLCFILAGRFNSFDIAPNRYLDLDDGQLQTFHQLLKKKSNYTTSICSTGKAFQESLRAEDIHFRWETPKLLPISDLEESTMLSYLKPFKPLRENRFDANNFPEPARNPTILSDTEKQCDFCNDTTCYCLLQRLPKYNIRIKRYHGKGLGLQAVSNQFGAIVFEAGTLLGFLTGRLVPPKTCNHDMAAAMDDCQLDCSEMGNCFRLLNHACPDHAVAGLKKRRVSGQKMLAVEALQDIRSGTEITIDYGLKSCHLDCHSCCG
ncbi:SET domain-containing protein [Cryphonectria parasitica EP155]|uniref:SET domain-containing protein n=1 Tax=Cryphonectria parasitica (strain ATCC 38755 / EP155) TaxID=660469 RepID=A0A9P5CJC8_CRYP1|nr:SET domain-containing protein [Cryphonectria parasitica EP155]KAF3760067.1 SET domain-containing protein [Cryphonectria parasitica EP155]